MRNPTGSAINVRLMVPVVSTITPNGYGQTLDVSTGYIIMPAGAMKCVNLDKISAFLQGAVAVTGSTGGFASLVG